MKNFHVDDLLKSVEDEEYAKYLTRRVQKMCSAGGFNLTKFISNNKLVLMSIPENLEELPTERALECRKRSALFQTESKSREHN